ncbi:hypothetical protein DSUL_20204 [Desulfovibrionales bacterium]
MTVILFFSQTFSTYPSIADLDWLPADNQLQIVSADIRLFNCYRRMDITVEKYTQAQRIRILGSDCTRSCIRPNEVSVFLLLISVQILRSINPG